jgi:hypothetical protein
MSEHKLSILQQVLALGPSQLLVGVQTLTVRIPFIDMFQLLFIRHVRVDFYRVVFLEKSIVFSLEILGDLRGESQIVHSGFFESVRVFKGGDCPVKVYDKLEFLGTCPGHGEDFGL